jgi:hypothetical protein
LKVAEQTFNGYTEEAIDSPQANADGHVARATEIYGATDAVVAGD